MRSTSLAYCLLAVFAAPMFFALTRALPKADEGDACSLPAAPAPASIGLTPRTSLELIDVQLRSVRPVELRREETGKEGLVDR